MLVPSRIVASGPAIARPLDVAFLVISGDEPLDSVCTVLSAMLNPQLQMNQPMILDQYTISTKPDANLGN